MLSEKASSFAQPGWWAGQGCRTEVIGDGGRSKQKPAELEGRAKSCKLCGGSQVLAERGGTPLSPAKTGNFSDPGCQNMKAEIKELREYLHYIKSNSMQITAWPENKVFKRTEGVGLIPSVHAHKP